MQTSIAFAKSANQNRGPEALSSLNPSKAEDRILERFVQLGSPEARELIENAQRTLALLDRASAERSRVINLGEQAFQTARTRSIDDALAAISIDTIQGRSAVAALKQRGCTNVRDLLKYSEPVLQMMPGVGPATATRTMTAARLIRDSVIRDLVVHVDTKKPTPEYEALLICAYRLDRIDDSLTSLPAFRKSHEDLRSSTFAAMIGAKGRLFRMFAGRNAREQGTIALDQLQGLMHSIELGRAVDCAKSMLDQTVPADVWSDFVGRAPDYFHHLQQFGVSETKVRHTSAEGLTQAIVSAVTALELDTSLLAVRLRGYQTFGAKYALVQRRVLLGDEMGLGKTIQALAVICHLTSKGDSEFIVVCPGAVIANWEHEVRNRSQLEPVPIFGPSSQRFSALQHWRKYGGIAIMSYESARSFDRTGDLHNLRPALVVVDEAHYAKNRNAGRSIAIERLARQSKQLLLMTGTPMENRLEEFASLLEFVSPTIASKIPTDPLQALSLSPKALRELVAPVYLRRNQEDVLTELPARIDSDEWLKPGKPEKAAYLRAVKERNFMGMRRSITIGDGSKSTSKMERLLEIIDESAEEGQRVIVFSFFTRVVETICGILPVVHGPITGRTPPYERQRIIDDFGSSPAPAVLVAQIQAGGTGLNIQAASVVVLMEPQIKPSLEEQAIARAHRMGQTRPVHVFRLLAAESVDERMVQMLARKRGDFESFARDSSIKEATAEAVEISDSAMANEIIRLERIRLGLDAAELPTSADDSSVVKSGRRNNPDDAGQTKLSY